MSGLDEILNIIETQQKQNEESIIKAAEKKAEMIRFNGDENAKKAYDEYMSEAKAQAERDFLNTCGSVDAGIKRRILAHKVKLINATVDKTLENLGKLPFKEYFELLARIAEKRIRKGSGILFLSKNDLDMLTPEFEERLNRIAAEKGGTVTVSREPANIADGFILQYGLISENCTFSAIIEAEKEEIRDTAAKVLFG